MGFFFHHLRGETKKVIIRLPLGSFRRFQLKSMNYSGFKKKYKNCEYFLESDVDFKVEYMDSKMEPLIQVADLLANCKFQRFEYKSKDLKILLDKKPDTCCRKHPKHFSSQCIA